MSTAQLADAQHPWIGLAPSPKVTANSSPDVARRLTNCSGLFDATRSRCSMAYRVLARLRSFKPVSSQPCGRKTIFRSRSGWIMWTARLRSPSKCSPPSPKPPMRPASRLQRRFRGNALGVLPPGKQSLLESSQRPRHAVSGLRSIRGMLHSRPRDRRTRTAGRSLHQRVGRSGGKPPTGGVARRSPASARVQF